MLTNHSLRTYLLMSIIFRVFPTLYAQQFLEDITQIFEFPTNRKAIVNGTATYENKIVLAPIISYKPTTNLGIGVGAKYLFKPKNASTDTRTSNIPLSAIYTLNNQFIFFSSYTVFLNKEKWLIKGNGIYSIFPIKYFGQGGLSVDENAFDITYDNILLEPLLLRRIRPK
ncbi:MAG: hypothetical protein AAF960_15240 [Bacteroidota bacterium]